jgi:LuxR family transcriptional regulator, maltose regulon positive regulatory protein
LLAALGAKERESSATLVPSVLTEPLSERELEVLQLLNTHLSSTEIAEQLCISANTVRFHIKNIYGKLSVHSRSDAVQRAEVLGLL